MGERYVVPTMEEIRRVPKNGARVVSTFSGGGGSCTGYRMAGFDVVWANEFAPHAQAVYRANWPDSYLETKDIRLVSAAEILDRVGMKEGELDLFDGSPPCQAFSTAGTREGGWGKDKVYEHGAKQKNEELFFEWTRLLRGLRPKMFVAENVKGLMLGNARGFLVEILREMRSCGYRVEARLLDAQWLGVPQHRERVFFVGVRDDLGLMPAWPKPLAHRVTMRDALPHLVDVQVDQGGFSSKTRAEDEPSPTVSATQTRITARVVVGNDAFMPKWASLDDEVVAPTVMAGGPRYHQVDHNGRRKMTIAECCALCSFPSDYQWPVSYAHAWRVLGNSVPPLMTRALAAAGFEHILAKRPAC